jgi:hypothetical protein
MREIAVDGGGGDPRLRGGVRGHASARHGLDDHGQGQQNGAEHRPTHVKTFPTDRAI